MPMTIIYEKEEYIEVLFALISYGDYFIDEDQLYMKIGPDTAWEIGRTATSHDLIDNAIRHFSRNHTVTLADVTMQVYKQRRQENEERFTSKSNKNRCCCNS